MENNQSLAEKKSKSVYEQVKKAEKVRKTTSEKIQRGGRSFIGGVIYFGMPLFSLAVFAGIIIFGTIPSVRSILNDIETVKEKNDEIARLDRQIAQLDDLKSQEAQMRADLLIIDSIVPSRTTQVAKFVQELEDLAEENNLEKDKSSSSESIEKLEEEIKKEAEKQVQSTTAAIIHIPTSSEYIAKFEGIESFLNALYEKDDFIIVSSLDLNGFKARQLISRQQESEGERVTVNTNLSPQTWSMKVTFEKYQFSKGFDDFIFDNLVPITAKPNEQTLEFIREKYGR